MSGETCRTCRYWIHHGDPEDTGDCRRHAPSPYVAAWMSEVLRHLTQISWHYATATGKELEFRWWENAAFDEAEWPGTASADWCGDHVEA